MNRDVDRVFASLEPETLDVVEISGSLRGNVPWHSYAQLEFPDFDLCHATEVPGPYDLVICEQVLEHVERPETAARTLWRLCKPNGLLLVSTPFLLRLHGHPSDYWRFTPTGLERLLQWQGFSVLWVRSWGNRRVVRGNFRHWLPYRRWRSLRTDPDLPVVVWALARASADHESSS